MCTHAPVCVCLYAYAPLLTGSTLSSHQLLHIKFPIRNLMDSLSYLCHMNVILREHIPLTCHVANGQVFLSCMDEVDFSSRRYCHAYLSHDLQPMAFAGNTFNSLTPIFCLPLE